MSGRRAHRRTAAGRSGAGPPMIGRAGGNPSPRRPAAVRRRARD
ncbi:hypothetical protein Ae263Ps1_3287 [Pseudonocardia sp. Ae263_Ps1]|nr:hypothetical protein Ae263Ps1_3287 [Pseudonocardia sp. Ae263_Ps1]OLL93737.1 hypothetical protein Ae356Ps1_3634c [Pseudonocardia sp. Ae356_Ps1]